MKTDVFQPKIKTIWLLLLLFALILPSWLINIDKVINVDEPRWVVRGSNYYYALTHRDFENTIYEYHPGITNQWIIGTALHFYFPQYRGFGQGYFDPQKPNFEEFLRENGKEAIALVRNSRFIQVFVLSILAMIAYILIKLLTNSSFAFLSVSLAILSPFYLGHSRLLNLEGMLSFFVLISFLGMYVYINKGKKIIYLLISGVSFGLAQLTKSSSIALMGLVGLILFVELFKKDETPLLSKLTFATKTFGIWLASAALIYFILWPGMWVNPARMLSEVYGNAFSYAFQGGRLDVTEELNPSSFNLENRFDGVLLYLGYWLSGTTFITWLGIIFAGFLLFSKSKEEIIKTSKSLMVYLLILGSLFILMFGLAQGRNAPHYILSSFVALDVIAGIGWGSMWLVVQNQYKRLNEAYVSIIFIVILALSQIGFGLPYAPYYFTYKNPLASQPATFAYGEGYDLAADYLMQKPNANEMRAYVYNGMGTFSYFFSGETLVFKRVYLIDESFEQIADEIKSSDYLVLYPAVREKHPETEKIFGVLENVIPEKIIVINGIDYVYIYKVSEIPNSVYVELVNQ